MSEETLVPVFYGMFVLASTALWPMVLRSRIRLGNVAIASLLAGPIFAGCAALPILPVALASNSYESTDASIVFLILAIVIIIGTLIAVPTNLLGSAVMIRFGDHALWARRPSAWALVGAVAAATPFVVSGFMAAGNSGLVLAFATTGACCALVCRRHVSWERQAPSARHDLGGHGPG